MELVHVSRDAIPRPTLGASLRAARLARNISLDVVAAHTKINPRFFRDLERDDLSKWPASQFYRESYLRGYAEAVGLNPAEVVQAFRRELVATPTSDVTTAATQRRLTPVTIPIIIAITFLTIYALARWTTAVQRDPEAAAGTSAARAPIESVSPTQTEVPSAAPTAPAGAGAKASVVRPPVEPASANQTEVPTAVPTTDAPSTADIDQIEGELMITSSPPGARVTVNGIGRGPTPALVRFLPPGSYTVRFLLPGYSSTIRNAEISPKRLLVRVSATLEPAPLPKARVPAESSAPNGNLDGTESTEKHSEYADTTQTQ